MRVALVYPPDFSPPTMPFGSLPLLGACLGRAGYETLVMDLNAEAFTIMLQPENLDRYFRLLDGYTDELGAKPNRTAVEDQVYETYRFLHLFPRKVIQEAREAKRLLQDPVAFYDAKLYTHASRVINAAHVFLHAQSPALDSRNDNFSTLLYAHLDNETPDPYTDVYANNTMPRLAAFGPGLIAMTCPFSRQIGPAMKFAKAVRKQMPHVRFVVGGTAIYDAQHILLTNPAFFDTIDYAITGDGEDALIDLIAAIEGRKPFEDVAGLWRKVDGQIVRPARFQNVDMDASPTPDYRGIDFSHYMLPEPSATYTTSRGCYYGKCTFCAEGYRINFRMRSPEKVYEDIRDIVNNQGVRNLHFFDPLTPPRTLAYLSRNVARENLPLNWFAVVKFEKIYTSRDYVRGLSQGGCRILQFGFESGVQRVLDRMRKGNKLDQIEIMLDNLKDHGIRVGVSWFIGFPNEDEDDARETWRFFRRHWDEMHYSLYTGTFGLGHDIPVFQKPEEYDIKVVFNELGDPQYTRNDGGDWDQHELHDGYFVRRDLPMVVSGASLLHMTHAPDLIYKIRGSNAVGPMSWEDPPIPERFAALAPENGYLDVGVGEDGVRKYKIFVAHSGCIFDADEADIALLRKVGPEGRLLSEILDDDDNPPDALDRLARHVDRGFIESADPKLEATALASLRPAGRI